MQMRMIACDLDRTLLRGDTSVSNSAKEAIAACRKMGIRFVPATARAPRSARKVLEGIEIDALITLSGAIVTDGEWEQHFPLNRKDAESALRRILEKKKDATISVEAGGMLYANFDLPVFGAVRWDGFPLLPKGELLKIIVTRDAPETQALVEASIHESMYMTVGDNKLLQIMDRGASKWQAVSRLAERWGIGNEEILCFGDDHDDKEMLQRAGMGVAVANAVPEVLKSADLQTASNEDDGVARFLWEKILR